MPVDVMPVDVMPVDVMPVDVMPVDVVPVDVVPVVVIDDNDNDLPIPPDAIARPMWRKSGTADAPTSVRAGDTVTVPEPIVLVVEKVAGDPLEGAGDPATATGVTVAALPCWLWAVAMCPWCATAWWTAWATCPAPERTTRSSRHEADPESDGTKRRTRDRRGLGPPPGEKPPRSRCSRLAKPNPDMKLSSVFRSSM
jgi:hypothetical protein